ncbi:DNA translocase FtsK [Streptococcus infantis SK1302]|uniref:DNA translocase FtsK n=1 Tax=Streptococcus infantis SK1302 TaxID=871237 RepID=A0ABN0B3J7_9STRE|nr:DNA translocase FtsK [Streptococcus infantis SK1302]
MIFLTSLIPVVTNPRKASKALQKVVDEMENRYELFAKLGS